MSSFKDTEGRIWTLRLTVASIRRIKDIAGVDVGDFSVFREDGPFADLANDSCKFVEILYAALKPEAERLGVSLDDFMGAFVADTVATASEAFLEALADFFQGGRGLLIRRALETSRKAKREAETAMQKLAEEDLPFPSGI